MADLNGVDVPADFLDAISWDPHFVSEVLPKIGAHSAYWRELLAAAFHEKLLAKKNLDEAKARAYLEEKVKTIAGGEKFTEALADAKVGTHPDVLRAMEASIEAEAEEFRIRGRVMALSDSKDAALQIHRQRLMELNGDPTLRSIAAREAAASKVPA